MIKFILLLLLSITSFAQLTDTQRQELLAKNLLKNPGGENGLAHWSTSAGTLAHTTTAAQVASGKGAINIDFAADGDILSNAAVAIPVGAYGNVGVAVCSFKGEAAFDANLRVFDGTNVLATVAITSGTTKFTRTAVYFSFPSSGNIQLQVEANAATSDIYVDDCYLGLADGAGLSNVSQAEVYGTSLHTVDGSCFWSTTSSSYAAFSAVSACSTASVTGKLEAPATKIPAAKTVNIGPSKYKVSFSVTTGESGSDICQYRITDGTNSISEVRQATGGASRALYLSGIVEYSTAQSEVVFSLQAKRISGAGTGCFVYSTGQPLEITVEKFPLNSAESFTTDTSNYYVNATISGAHFVLGTAAVASYKEMTAATSTLTNHTLKGSIAGVEHACSGTNPSTGTTCAVGDESNGIAVPIYQTGLYDVCVDFASFSQDSSGNTKKIGYKIVQTENASQTLVQDGVNRVAPGHRGVSSADVVQSALRICETFSVSAGPKRTFRLFFQKDSTSGIGRLTSEGTGTGNEGINWTISKTAENKPAPIFPKTLSTNAMGKFRVESAYISNSGTPVVAHQSGNWINSITDDGVGQFTLNFVAGTFSSTPVCVCMTTGNLSCSTIGVLSASSYGFRTTSFVPVATDKDATIICMGQF